MDLSGFSVGKISTGSTGIQLAPEIAKTCTHLTVFQRTTNYSVPARNTSLDAFFVKSVRENYEELKTGFNRRQAVILFEYQIP